MLRHLSIYYRGGYRQEFDILVPNGILGKYRDPGIQGTSLGNSMYVEDEQPKPCLPRVSKRAAVETQQRWR
jgi:hypothetical protein